MAISPRIDREMSVSQEAYIRDLIAIHELTSEQEHKALDMLNHPPGTPYRLSMTKASAWIDRLKQLPRRVVPTNGKPATPPGYLTVEYIEVASDRHPTEKKRIGQVVGGENPVPQGRYAIPNPNPNTQDTNDLAFYFLWVGDRGGWKVYQKAGPEEFGLDIKQGARIVRLISKDPLTATQTYGRELGYCGMCGRELTNQESREFGIGPVCRARL